MAPCINCSIRWITPVETAATADPRKKASTGIAESIGNGLKPFVFTGRVSMKLAFPMISHYNRPRPTAQEVPESPLRN